MELTNTQFAALSNEEMMDVEGGGFTAFIYALGFIAGTSPLMVCVGAGLVVAGAGCCIYGIAHH